MQTREVDVIDAMAAASGSKTEEYRQPGNCVLLAYDGDAPVGIVAIVTSVDSGRVSLLWVVEAMRRRGIGTALITAARKAAHTRGARMLCVSDRCAGAEFLRRLGFKPNSLSDEPWTLDLSRDGIIER